MIPNQQYAQNHIGRNETKRNTWAEDREAYRKIFDYRSGNPDREQIDNLRLGILQSSLRNLKSEI